MNQQFGREEKVPLLRLTVVQYGILGIFLVLAYGLWRLQVAGSDKYETMAEKNRVRTVPILAPRGKILDREGRVLVDNYPSFSVLLLRDQVRTLDPDIEKIAAGLNISPGEIRDRVRRVAFAPAYEPIILKDDITPDELAFVESHRNELPELETIKVHRRLYPKNGFLAHVIGYVGEVSEQMLNSPRYELYEPGMVVGQSGIEQEYNDVLIGKDGSRRVVVNSKGKEVGRLSETSAVAGNQLKLTIDLDLQIAAEQALGDRNGAIVAYDPRTGEILAMVSRPAFDPNAFAVRITRQEWTRLVTDDEHPLLNKAIQAQLAPGSTFKIIMATAGLQEGIAQTLHVNCPGGATFYGRYFRCWIAAEHRAHGGVEITKGIYQSCDVFFYTLAERLGIGRIAKYATAFGLGRRTGIDLPNEASGVMPSEEWKAKNYKQKWYAGETISVGIGQGAVAATPIQMTRAISGMAMGGVLRRPHVVFEDEMPQPELQRVAAYPSPVKLELDPKNWEIITDAMSQVPSPLGTAPSAALPGIDFAGKTGSAQTMSNALAQKKGQKHSMKDNAWFVGFTPRRDPEVAVGVLFEGGEHGQFAARMAAQVIKAYVDKYHPRQAQPKAADLKKNEKTRPAVPSPKPSEAAPTASASAPRERAAVQSGGARSPSTGSSSAHNEVVAKLNPAEGGRAPTDSLEFTGMWSAGDEMRARRFRLPHSRKVTPSARAAPGISP